MNADHQGSAPSFEEDSGVLGVKKELNCVPILLRLMQKGVYSSYTPEPIPPKPNRLVTDIDAALVQQVFNISKRKRKTDIHHHCQADDLRRRLEVAKWRGFCHPETLRNRPALFKSVSSDTALSMNKCLSASLEKAAFDEIAHQSSWTECPFWASCRQLNCVCEAAQFGC